MIYIHDIYMTYIDYIVYIKLLFTNQNKEHVNINITSCSQNPFWYFIFNHNIIHLTKHHSNINSRN